MGGERLPEKGAIAVRSLTRVGNLRPTPNGQNSKGVCLVPLLTPRAFQKMTHPSVSRSAFLPEHFFITLLPIASILARQPRPFSPCSDRRRYL